MAPKSLEKELTMDYGDEAMIAELTELEGGTTEPARKSSIFAARDGHDMEFVNILLSTKSKDPKKSPPKEILKSLSGSFQAKTLTAIMGPSGSGKTSLLKVLTGRISASKKLDLSGEIQLDRKVVDPTDIEIRRTIAYVEQEVSIPATCTPREAITFSARLRLDKNISDADIDFVVNDILDNLNLQHCADTFIGGGVEKRNGFNAVSNW
jgi:ABC-type multidrug transport system ATPase subunit